MKHVGWVGLVMSVLVVGCAGDSSTPSPPPIIRIPDEPAPIASELNVSAGLDELEPENSDTVSGTVDLSRLGVTKVDRVYDLTTPKDEPFAFNVFLRATGNQGAVRISLAHAANGGLTPRGGATTIALAGIVPSETGVSNRFDWVDVTGNGFARLSLSGQVVEEQVLLVQGLLPDARINVLIRIKIGTRSVINVDTTPASAYPHLKTQQILYSSNSWRFGHPTVTISGDRTTVVAYEGKRPSSNLPEAPFVSNGQRYELRLQHDDTTGQVTGGAIDETSSDTGHWRDHEIAALFNVLALVRTGAGKVSLQLSYDRGATFSQTAVLSKGHQSWQRLVQIAMAADYTLAVLYWRVHQGDHELVLVEGSPDAFDSTGSPTHFAFDSPEVIYHTKTRVVPMILGAAYSDGGDLVIGYAFTRFVRDAFPRRQITEYRCAVRLYGEPSFRDTLVDEEDIVALDPSVSLIGQGAGMQIFYAYEVRDGVRLAVSSNAGQTFTNVLDGGDRFAFQPTVYARKQGSDTRVDLIYIQGRGLARELRVVHWDAFGTSQPERHTLVGAHTLWTTQGFKITGTSWLGYDATLDGDDVVLVHDQVSYRAITLCGVGLSRPQPAGGGTGAAAAAPAPPFVPADPPPLAPGLTQPLPAPNPDHQHQLELLRLD